MGNEKFKYFLLVLVLILIIVGIPYFLYTTGTSIEINYFGYLNNWWVVLLFIIALISIFILGGIDIEKNMSYFFLLLFTIPFFILGIRFGVNPSLESYVLLLDKEKEIDHLDSIQLKLENDLAQLADKSLMEQNPEFKNHEIIFFTSGSAQLSDFNKRKITTFVSNLKNCKLNISGYTDGSGTKASNMNISNKRAQSVADFINSINQGNNTINKINGFGDDYKLVENINEISSSKNRRVTIEIVGKMDKDAEALRDEISKNRSAIKNLKVARDSLRKIIYKDIEG